jgi:predicted signal transduction protein with EAL and GGDEF domain
MERIAKSIAHGLKVEADPTYTITASVGMAEWSAKDPISKKDLVERADRAMYFGKRNGKNRIVTWSPEIDQPPLAAQAKAPDDDDPLQSKAFLPLPSK